MLDDWFDKKGLYISERLIERASLWMIAYQAPFFWMLQSAADKGKVPLFESLSPAATGQDVTDFVQDVLKFNDLSVLCIPTARIAPGKSVTLGWFSTVDDLVRSITADTMSLYGHAQVFLQSVMVAIDQELRKTVFEVRYNVGSRLEFGVLPARLRQEKSKRQMGMNK